MSKERLEEIEKNLDPLGYGMGGHLISVNDIYWLVRYAKEQSERVQELEVWYHSYHKEAKLNNILKIQNKRYREQLELIRKDTFYEDYEFVSVRHLIRKRVDKALKGE